jgi:hypothetical protein
LAEEEQPGQIGVPLVWVGVEDLPVFFVNQFIGQVDHGEVFLTVGAVLPPALLAPTPEERKVQAESLEFVQVKPVARLGFTPARLRELVSVLQITLDNFDAQERMFGDPRDAQDQP